MISDAVNVAVRLCICVRTRIAIREDESKTLVIGLTKVSGSGGLRHKNWGHKARRNMNGIHNTRRVTDPHTKEAKILRLCPTIASCLAKYFKLQHSFFTMLSMTCCTDGKGGQQHIPSSFLLCNLTPYTSMHHNGTSLKYTRTCLVFPHVHVLKVSQIDLLLLCWRS